MGYVYEEITLKNAGDISSAKRGYIKEPEIRQTTVTAMVDTGSLHLVINEEVRSQLGLSVESPYIATLADGSVQTYGFSEAVQVHWKNRMFTCPAVVVPNATSVLLGAIPLEAMDLIVNPIKQELIGAHGDEPLFLLF